MYSTNCGHLNAGNVLNLFLDSATFAEFGQCERKGVGVICGGKGSTQYKFHSWH